VLAAAAVRRGGFDVVLSDIDMPGLDGIGLLRAVRQHDLDLPVVLITANPNVETAIAALEHGALRYLVKPVAPAELAAAVTRAAQLRRMAEVKRQAVSLLAGDRFQVGDRASLEPIFERALDGLWMAYQPIVHWQQRRTFAWEALVRSREPAMGNPGALFDAAERLGRLPDVGRRIRRAIAVTAQAHAGATLFVNLHPNDLLDDDLFSPDAALSQVASRVVLEITERAALDHVSDVRARIAALRALGFRIAIDDLGAGYAGLSSFAQLEPEVVKIDMSLVRDIHLHATKRKLVRSITSLCADLGLMLVTEGIECAAERDTLVEMGCELLQGYLFARPSHPLPDPTF
jgi:EAL domain-containing protein (putative c-di-GMP-specific phosphodiesterase class I)